MYVESKRKERHRKDQCTDRIFNRQRPLVFKAIRKASPRMVVIDRRNSVGVRLLCIDQLGIETYNCSENVFTALKRNIEVKLPRDLH